MGIIRNYALEAHNRRHVEQFLLDASERNAEIFFALGVTIGTKDIQLFFPSEGGIDRIIDIMENCLNALKAEKAKKRN